MAKVFTITPGLENMGAMKTGGQGSVYKGRRIGEIITAIKLLPTPIFSESADDKNYRDFNNEVQKLYKVNEVPNPNVVKILGSGLSDTGNFPYIEMAFIEGPDLEELLKPPHDPVFTIKEVLKVAEQLSNALAHCHRADVKHGDIKSNNVKYNIHTGNYVLLDFGLAMMSDEERRTSLRHAGAIEFMAPEQNEGQMLFETDIYSFGVIIFELLAGRVPFPLQDKGETARNLIRLSHIETTPPEIIPLRLEALPVAWTQNKRIHEMQVPDWLLKMMYKCLEKKPENRFRNGWELNDFIVYNSTHASQNKLPVQQAGLLQSTGEKENIEPQLLQYQNKLAQKEKEILELKAIINNNAGKTTADSSANDYSNAGSKQNGVSKASFITLLVITLALAAYSAKNLLNGNTSKPQNADVSLQTEDTSTNLSASNQNLPAEIKAEPAVKKQKPADTTKKTDLPATLPATEPDKNVNTANEDENNPADEYIISGTPSETIAKPKAQDQYVVTVKAYFYTSPDENTRRNAYMVPSDNAKLKAMDDQNGFIYVIFTNSAGQISKGWLRKADLKAVVE